MSKYLSQEDANVEIKRILDILIGNVRTYLPDNSAKISIKISYPKWDEIEFDFKLYDNNDNILETILKTTYGDVSTITVKQDFNENDREKFENEYCVSDYIHNQFYTLLNESLYPDTYYYYFV